MAYLMNTKRIVAKQFHQFVGEDSFAPSQSNSGIPIPPVNYSLHNQFTLVAKYRL